MRAPLLVLLLLCSCQRQEAVLKLLVWEGYADPAMVRAFEDQHRCKIVPTYMSSSDQLLARLGDEHTDFDVVSPSSDVASTIVQKRLVAPLDLQRIAAYRDLAPRLTDMDLVKAEGQVYGVPLTWGPNPLLYDTTVFASPPQSWAVLWDPKHRGKIAVWDDLSTVYMAAQLLGYDHPDPRFLYNMTDEQLKEVHKKLVELIPNVRQMWASASELVKLFEERKIVLAMGWPLMTIQLRQRGFPIGETIPEENTTGWIDHLMIVKRSRRKELAHQFLAYMITPAIQRRLADVTGYIPASGKAKDLMGVNQQRALHLDNLAAYQSKIYFWQNVPRRDRYNDLWRQVKAGR